MKTQGTKPSALVVSAGVAATVAAALVATLPSQLQTQPKFQHSVRMYNRRCKHRTEDNIT